jgi:transposase
MFFFISTNSTSLLLTMDLLQDPPDLIHSSNSENGLFLEGIHHSIPTTRDQRRDVQILYKNGWKHKQIAAQLGLTENQVKYAFHQPATPQKRKGRPGKLTPIEVENLIQWICASKANRRCPWYDISIAAGLSHVSYYAVRYALRKAGFRRRAARRKPPISEKNRIERLKFAEEHVNWT